MGVEIRRAVAADVPVILRLIRALAEYEKEPDAVVATEVDLLRDGFGEKPSFEVLLAYADGNGNGNADGNANGNADGNGNGNGNADAIGFALYFFSYSTWNGRPCLHLEDLFVDPAARGRGAGVALMSALAKIAIAAECRRFVWQVLDWNAPAIAFYEKLGAKIQREWLTVRLEGGALEALAARC